MNANICSNVTLEVSERDLYGYSLIIVKTAGHGAQHAVRIVPIAPELQSILFTLFERAKESIIDLIPTYRPGCNLNPQFRRIIIRAGIKPWPRLFHNLRGPCATDWCETFPSHDVASWLGHLQLIAAKHYLTARNLYFDRAAGITHNESGAKCGAARSRIKSH